MKIKRIKRIFQIVKAVIQTLVGIGFLGAGILVAISSAFYGLLGFIGFGIALILLIIGLLSLYLASNNFNGE